MDHMTKWELFVKVAKAIHELVNPSEGEIYQVIQNYLDGEYCPTCGSCGETGCFSPDRCNAVICVYGASNLKDYKELLEENEALRNKVTELEEHSVKLERSVWETGKMYADLKREVEETSKKKLTWGELADINTQEYDPSGYPKL